MISHRPRLLYPKADMKKKLLSLTLTAVVGLLDPAAAAAGPQTFNRAIELATSTAPAIAAKRLGIDASRSAARSAGALPDPKVKVAFDSFPISGPLAFDPAHDNFSMLRLGLAQEVPNAAKRHARVSRARTDITAAEAEAEVKLREVQVSTALAWIDLAYAERRLGAVDAVLQRLRPRVASLPAGVASGTVRPEQAVAARPPLLVLEDRRSAVIADRERARAELTRWTGDLAPEAVGAPPLPDVNTAKLRDVLDHLPVVQMAAAVTGQADADVAVARAEKRPDFGFEVAYQRRDPRFGDYVSAGVTIGLPLFTRNRQTPLIAARVADAAKARAQEEDVRRALVGRFTSDIADHAMHHEQWERARDSLLPLIEQRVNLSVASYAARRSSLADVVDAHVALADATLEVLDREAAVERDAAKLNLTYGDAE
jgi:cobalt-zinc-cadmium efflux system outer membrane protein